MTFSEFVRLCFKVVRGQLERDRNVLALVAAMEDIYSIVEDSESFQNKLRSFEDTIKKIMTQTIECVIFVREYTGHGFAGTALQCGERAYTKLLSRKVDF